MCMGEQTAQTGEYIITDGMSLHCLRIGQGPRLVFAFHGYAHDASMFSSLQCDDCTILGVDLPFQGRTKLKKGSVLTPKSLASVVTEQMRIHGAGKCTLMGYSIGARACLAILTQIPEYIDAVLLLAPDGIQPGCFYRFLVKTCVGRSLFRNFVRYGDGYLKLFSSLSAVGVLSRSRSVFVRRYTRTLALRERLYDIWCGLSMLTPDPDQVISLIERHEVPVYLMMGKYDEIIPLRHAVNFKKKSTLIHLHVFNYGHNLLHFPELRSVLIRFLSSASKHRPETF